MNKTTSKELDKFYTKPCIAKRFVDIIDQIVGLKEFDLIIEPSAGSGNILQFLPENSLGLDLSPDAPGIIKQDFLKYYPEPGQKISVIGNPPFGKGYMNPLAKAFFNHSALWADTICFIVPAKWHTSWKVHSQLNKQFGLYYSELLPKNSFLFNEAEYDVNCCMQIWSKRAYGTNIRLTDRPKTSHPDFDLFLTCDNVKRRIKVREQLRNREYWDFGLKYWGKIDVCDIIEIPELTTTHYLFKAHQPYVRTIIETIDWKKYITNMGAPNIGGKSIIIQAYNERKSELGYDIDAPMEFGNGLFVETND